MMSDTTLTVVTGAVFGAALTASGVFPPSVINSQLELKEFHMVIVFLSASAVSAVVMALLEHLDIVKSQTRNESTIGRFGRYDANVLGGLLQGIGMALTGACPGTVFVQLVNGVKSAVPALIGGIAGGILFARYGSAIRKDVTTDSKIVVGPQTISTKFGVDPNRVLWTFEIICFIIIGISSFFGLNGSGALLHPVLGGAFIGLAQGASLLLTGRALGVSTAYDAVGRYFWYALDSQRSSRPPSRAIMFALGILLGAYMLPPATSITTEITHIGAIRAFVGGCTMIFGARLAGGCTSGHGISGMSTFSISSIITVAAMFGGGIVMAKLLAVT